LKIEDLVIEKELGRSKIRVQHGKGHEEGDEEQYAPLGYGYILIHLLFNSFFLLVKTCYLMEACSSGSLINIWRMAPCCSKPNSKSHTSQENHSTVHLKDAA
jgi:hypothetical protein